MTTAAVGAIVVDCLERIAEVVVTERGVGVGEGDEFDARQRLAWQRARRVEPLGPQVPRHSPRGYGT